MNVGTVTAKPAADPVLSLSSSAGGARDAGGFAAVLRDAGGPGTAAEPGAATERTAGAPNEPSDTGAEDPTASVAPEVEHVDEGDANGTGNTGANGDTAQKEVVEAAAAELVLVMWQRSTTGLPAAAPPSAPTEAANTPIRTDLALADATKPGVEAALAPAAGAIAEAPVPPGTDPMSDDPGVDLTGMRAAAEAPLEKVALEAVDVETSTPDDGRSSPQGSPDVSRLTGRTGAPAPSAPAAADVAPIATEASAPTIEAPTVDAPTVEPVTPATPQAPTRADAIAAPSATIRADELQRAIADTARQLADQGGGRHRISVHITSPDLGQVVIEIVSRGSEVRVTLQPQEAGAGGSLQQQQQAVARALATEGFTLSGFDVQTGHSDGRNREDAPQQQGAPALDDELGPVVTTIDDGALRL
jgi:hypothetical protein